MSLSSTQVQRARTIIYCTAKDRQRAGSVRLAAVRMLEDGDAREKRTVREKRNSLKARKVCEYTVRYSKDCK